MAGFISRNPVESCLHGDKKERLGEGGGGWHERKINFRAAKCGCSKRIQSAKNAPLHCQVSTKVQKECFVVPVTLTTQSRQS